jgi:hypothetical protein
MVHFQQGKHWKTINLGIKDQPAEIIIRVNIERK